jgi:hypothetical protein
MSFKTRHSAGLFLFAFLGGMTAQLLLSVAPVLAEQRVWNRYFAVSDATNTRGVETYVQNGATAQKFNDAEGRVRIQMGTYSGEEDKDMPMFALSDKDGAVRLLVRLRGQRQTPVIIMRDGDMRDRIVLGLEDGFGEEPFLATFDASGQQTLRFSKLQ